MDSKFAAGDVVCATFDYRTVAGEVVKLEPPNQAGQHQYLVHIPTDDDPTNNHRKSFSEDELTAVAPLTDSGPFSAQNVMAYLESGGLIEILRRGTGGRTPPTALLRENQDGLVYTWSDDPAHLRGVTIPFQTTERDQDGQHRIFAPARTRIILYLRGFGLSQTQATRVVDSFETYRPPTQRL